MKQTVNVCLVGASGFVGSAIERALESDNVKYSAVRSPRVTAQQDVGMAEVARWMKAEPQEFVRLCESFAGADVVINAAGLAQPDAGSYRISELMGANAVLPAVLQRAAQDAGAKRFIHVSSAAVQGNRDPLDESREHAPFSAYSESKARGEHLVWESGLDLETCVYRPTSVQGDRGRTRSIRRVFGAPVVPVFGAEDVPLPLALLENVAAAVVALATAKTVPKIALHPWEGMTVRKLVEMCGGRAVTVPRGVGTYGMRVANAYAARRKERAGVVRRAELFLVGQRQVAAGLADIGFRCPVGEEGYREIFAP